MANTLKGYGRIISGESFEFSMDGLSTADQMDRLIKLTSELLKTWDASKTGLAAELETATANLKDFGESLEDNTKAAKKLEDEQKRAKSALRTLFHGNLQAALETLDTNSARFAVGVGTLVGSLTGYADKLTEGLQRGISGNIFDYAVAAKTAGVNIEQFGKAIVETGGGFASLGVGATAGAKQFAALVSEVRYATREVGNMGMTNEQLNMFTAQQTKVAISQGFKGKQAQDVVIKNSKSLGQELDTLANRTGKSVLELAAAAVKLAQDPIVSNFVQTAKQGSEQISQSIQQFGASLRGIFGEAGESMASDALKAAFGNLPLSITKTGQNLIMGSAAVYGELERQAGIVRSNGKLTEQDQEKLRNLVVKEVEARGDELRMLANLEGPIGDSARQLLELGKQANFYNSAAGKQRSEEDKRAQAFNAQIRSFQANMQALSIPFLELINGIDWTAFMAVISGFTAMIKGILYPLQKLGELFGAENLPGTVIGGMMGLIAVGGLVYTAFTSLSLLSGVVSSGFKKAAEAAWQFAATAEVAGRRMMAGKAPMGPGAIPTPTSRAGRYGAGIGAGVLAAGTTFGIAQAMGGGSTGGAIGNIVGSTAVGMAGGALAGRFLGGALGAWAGPVGIAVGSVIGGIAGQALGEWLSGSNSADTLGSIGSEEVASGQKMARDSLNIMQNMDRTMTAIHEQNSIANSIAGYGNRIAADQVRATTNMGYRLG